MRAYIRSADYGKPNARDSTYVKFNLVDMVRGRQVLRTHFGRVRFFFHHTHEMSQDGLRAAAAAGLEPKTTHTFLMAYVCT